MSAPPGDIPDPVENASDLQRLAAGTHGLVFTGGPVTSIGTIIINPDAVVRFFRREEWDLQTMAEVDLVYNVNRRTIPTGSGLARINN